MAVTQIRGNVQIMAGTITNTEISASAAIATSKLADAANFILRNGSVAFTADQSMGGFKLTNVANPVSDSDAANKGWVMGVLQGLDVKNSVRVATTTNGALATAYENGDTVDGVTLATGDRILLKDQTAGEENGIYTVNASGAPTRATDADISAEVTSGMFTFVSEGTANAGKGFVLTTADPITLGTTALVFTQFSSAGQVVAGAGLTLTGNTVDVVSANGGIVVNANDIALTVANASLTIVSGGIKITDGTAGQVMVANASGIPTSQTLSGDVTSVSGTGAVTLNASTIVKTANYVVREAPSGSINGSNTAFTLASTPVAGTEQVYLNGILQHPGAGNDYTISGASITYLSAPQTNDKLFVTYLK